VVLFWDPSEYKEFFARTRPFLRIPLTLKLSIPPFSYSMSFAGIPRVLCLAIFAVACSLLPRGSHAFELDACLACLEEDVCNYCIKDFGERKQAVCDCNPEETAEYGDCEDESKWGANVNTAAGCNLLAYPKTAEVSIGLILLLIVVIFCTGCVVVSQFVHRNLCCCCGKGSKDGGRNNTEMPNLKAKSGREMI
jgi:hypothetical protein